MARIAGIDLPADRAVDGASFLPIFQGKPIRRHRPLYWQYDRALGWAKMAMRQGDWKILADAELKTFELYDIKRDISEKHNLAEKNPDRLKALAGTLRKIHAEVKAEGPRWPQRKPKPTRKK